MFSNLKTNKINNNIKKNNFTYYPYLIFFTVFFILIQRVKLGFPSLDEFYYSSVPYRFVLGSRMFIDSWEINQTSAILLAPFYYIYKQFVGSMDGVILFTRYAFIVIQLLLSLFIFHTIKRDYSKSISLLISITFFAYVPFLINAISYNTMGLFFTILTSLTFYHSNRVDKIKTKRILLFLTGALLSFTVLSYPVFVILLPIYLFYMVWTINKKNLLKGILFFILGGATIAFLFLTYVFCTTGFTNFMHNFHYLFGQDAYIKPSFIIIVKMYISSFFGSFILPKIFFSSLLLAFLNHFLLKERKYYFIAHLLFIVMVIYSYFDIIRLFFPGTSGSLNSTSICLLPFNLGMWTLIMYLTRVNRKTTEIMILFWLPSLFGSFAVYYGSNNGMIGASWPFIIAILACFLVTNEAVCKDIELSKNSIMSFLNSPVFKVFFYLSLSLFVIFLLYVRFYSFYAIGSTSDHTKINVGPAKGIKSTEQILNQYTRNLNEIHSLAPNDGSVLFLECNPLGYLTTDLLPSAPTTFRIYLQSKRFLEYYTNSDKHLPNFIYITKDIQEQQIQGTIFYDFFINKQYTFEETKQAYIFKKDK